jgi:hypothetical protein
MDEAAVVAAAAVAYFLATKSGPLADATPSRITAVRRAIVV